MTSAILIDLEFKNLIPALQDDERIQLETNLVGDGCRDPLTLWNGILIDGHNRYEICTRNGINFNTVQMQFETREDVIEWIIRNQFGRRNLSNYDRTKLALRLEESIQKRAKANQVRKPADSVCQISDKQTTAIDTKKEVAKVAQVSHDTVAKVKKIEAIAPPEIRQALSAGTMSINQAHKEVLRVEQKQIRSEQEWTQGETVRKNRVLAGVTVVASKRRNSEGKEVDAALISWAEKNGKLVLVDRNTDWGNPFEMPADGDRDTVCDNFEEHYLPHKPSLLSNLPKLRGKVLLCWCHPDRCHAQTLANLVNEEV
jgi:hypothetical protein